MSVAKKKEAYRRKDIIKVQDIIATCKLRKSINRKCTDCIYYEVCDEVKTKFKVSSPSDLTIQVVNHNKSSKGGNTNEYCKQKQII